MRTATVFLVGLLAAAQCAFADLKSATKVFEAGGWSVLRDVNMMTDKTDCTGIYKGNYKIQLSEDSLYISIGGGIESVTLRFGDEPPRSLRLAESLEKKVRAVIITGSDFESAMSSPRLRYQVGTLVSGIQQGEIDLTGARAANENIKAGCPAKGKSAA
jgi:hypothetical protein